MSVRSAEHEMKEQTLVRTVRTNEADVCSVTEKTGSVTVGKSGDREHVVESTQNEEDDRRRHIGCQSVMH